VSNFERKLSRKDRVNQGRWNHKVAGSLKRKHKPCPSIWVQNSCRLPKFQQFVASNPQPGIEIRSNRLEAYGVRDEKEACRVQIGHFMGKLTSRSAVCLARSAAMSCS
jgi:hypothetical protein